MVNKLLLKIFNVGTIIKVKLYPVFNHWYFNANGAKIGNNFNVIGKVSIIGQGKIFIGDNFMMTSGEHINPISTNTEASIFTDSSNAEIHIGANVGMSSPRMWIHNSLTIGNNVKIGAGVLIMDTDCHPMDYNVRRMSNDGSLSSPVVVEDDAWIGAHSIILKGVTIGARSIIGAGSVVSKSIPADCVAVGNPCTVIRKVDK